MSTSAAEEAVRALGERDDVLLLNALKLVASIAAHPGKNQGPRGPEARNGNNRESKDFRCHTTTEMLLFHKPLACGYFVPAAV